MIPAEDHDSGERENGEAENTVAALLAELERSVDRAVDGTTDDLAAVIDNGERLLRVLPQDEPRRADPLYELGMAYFVRGIASARRGFGIHR